MWYTLQKGDEIMIKIALLSKWHVHADMYRKEFEENENVQISAVWDDDKERGGKWAKELNVPFYEDYDELLKTDIDAVSVATSTNLHKEIIIKAAKAKKHIFTEKVLCFTESDAKEVKEAVLANGVKFTISFPHKTRPAVLKAKEIKDSGELGEITYMRVRNVHGGSIAGWLPEFFYDRKKCGGGAMMDLGAHPMYLLNWFMGEPETVKSAFTTVTGKPVEDNAVSILSYKNGAIGVSETGFVSFCDPYVIEISGTKGYLRITADELFVKTEKTNKEWQKEENLPMAGIMPTESFVSDILNNTQNPIYDIENAVKLSATMEKAYK